MVKLMAERNFYAYQLDFQRLGKDSKGEDEYQDYWNYSKFKTMVDDILSRDPNDIKKVHNGWFMILDEINEITEKINAKLRGKSVKKEHKYLTGRFMYAEYGYVGKLRDVDTLAQRANNKKTREGEEKFVYFYIRASDGLLLLQGDMKVIRSKAEDYFYSLGKDYLDNNDVINFSISTLLRGDFLDEVSKLEDVTKIEVELAVEKTSSFENEVMKKAKNQAAELEANYATITWQSKYKKKGLSGYQSLLETIKPKGTKAPVSGVSNIKVIGKQDGEYKRVYLSKISEKYKLDVKVDDKKNIDSRDMYNKVKDVGKKRQPLWRGTRDGEKD